MKYVLITFLLTVSLLAHADMIIETIDLRNRSSEEIIPIVKPMLIGDASITGTGYKLIIKSTPENIEQIKSLLKELDVDQNQLVIHVAVNNQHDMNKSGGSVSVQIQNNGNSAGIDSKPIGSQSHVTSTDSRIKYDARIFDKSENRSQPVAQTVRVSEGYWATIQMGQAIPIANRVVNPDGTVTETVTYRNVTSGFKVMPRTHGDQVTLTIMPQSDSIDPANPGSINVSGMETTITGKIGEWIHIGGTSEQKTGSSSGISYRTRVRETNHNQIWLKVEKPQHDNQH